MVFTTVLLVVSTVALPVETGTWSPTCKVATWLSMTTSEGLDRTLTSVTVCSASRIKLGWDSEPIRKLKPGKARLRKALVTLPAAEAMLVGVDVAVLLSNEPWSGLRPRFLLVRYVCTP